MKIFLGLAPDEVIPTVNNLCAGFLLTITRHLCHRIQRAMEFIERRNLIPPERRVLVRLTFDLFVTQVTLKIFVEHKYLLNRRHLFSQTHRNQFLSSH